MQALSFGPNEFSRPPWAFCQRRQRTPFWTLHRGAWRNRLCKNPCNWHLRSCNENFAFLTQFHKLHPILVGIYSYVEGPPKTFCNSKSDPVLQCKASIPWQPFRQHTDPPNLFIKKHELEMKTWKYVKALLPEAAVPRDLVRNTLSTFEDIFALILRKMKWQAFTAHPYFL